MSAPPASSKTRYAIPWIATYFLTALVLIAGSFVVVWYLEQFDSEFDYDNADVAFLEKITLSPEPRRGDFSALNGGDWQALCLVGWNARPELALSKADIPPKTTSAMIRAYTDKMERIEESEFLLVYADKAGKAAAVHHPHGFAFAGEGAAQCTGSSKPVLDLPVQP